MKHWTEDLLKRENGRKMLLYHNSGLYISSPSSSGFPLFNAEYRPCHLLVWRVISHAGAERKWAVSCSLCGVFRCKFLASQLASIATSSLKQVWCDCEFTQNKQKQGPSTYFYHHTWSSIKPKEDTYSHTCNRYLFIVSFQRHDTTWSLHQIGLHDMTVYWLCCCVISDLKSVSYSRWF